MNTNNITEQNLNDLLKTLTEEHINFNIDRLDNGELERLDDPEEYPTIRDEAIYYLDSEPLGAIDNVMFEQGERAIVEMLIRTLEDREQADEAINNT